MSGHSKGLELEYNGATGCIYHADGRIRAVVHCDCPPRSTLTEALLERDALGRQMAAVQELVEALREMLREYPDCGCTGDAPDSQGQVCGACMARAAFKKAGVEP